MKKVHAFGSPKNLRQFNLASARVGFNGKENDNDVKGTGNQQDYGMRIYDPRLGRFLSVDPITKQFSGLTPYQFSANTPIWAEDLDGLEPKYSNEKGYNVLGSDHLYNGNPNFAPVIKQPTQKTLGQQYFPESNQNITTKAQLSVGFVKTGDNYINNKVITGNDAGIGKIADLTTVKEGNTDAFYIEGGFKETIELIKGKQDLKDFKGNVILKDAPVITAVREKMESVTVGVLSLETREVYVNEKRESYQFRIGVDLTKSFKIPLSNTKIKNVKGEAGVNIKSDYININQDKKH